jgi:hypothetical protein
MAFAVRTLGGFGAKYFFFAVAHHFPVARIVPNHNLFISA